MRQNYLKYIILNGTLQVKLVNIETVIGFVLADKHFRWHSHSASTHST